MSQENESQPPVSGEADHKPWGLDENVFCLLLHLSRLLGYVLAPMVVWSLPLIMWLTTKEGSPCVDAHGKIVMNWILTLLVMGFGVCILTFATCGVGFWLFLPLIVLDVVWAIVGGVKANNGEVWKYPLSIRFLR